MHQPHVRRLRRWPGGRSQVPPSAAAAFAAAPDADLEAILSSLPAGVVVLGGGGRVRRANPAAEALLGEPLAGRCWREIIAGVFAPRLDDGHEISLRDGRRVAIATRPLASPPGQLLLITDATETRRLQERLNRHQRLEALGEMAASLAHQIRTPLAAALLYAAPLCRDDLPADQRRRFAARVQSRLQHLERLVSHMLIFARGGALPGESLSLAGLAGEFRQAMEPALAAAGGGALEVADNAPGARVLGSREALLAALQNLGHNALQAGARRLRLILAPGGADAWDVALADDGPGIPAAVQARVFEPFFTTRPQGTGLGLAVVRAIAAAHNGAVWLDSTPVSGCCVTLRLPRQADPETPA